MIVALLVACGTPAAPPLAVPTRAEDCDAEPAPELRTLCLVQVAGQLGRDGQAEAARAACAAVTDPTWSQECHFRAGEELARAGHLAVGLELCGKAGRFRTFCFTHAVWNAPDDGAPLPTWEALGAAFSDVEGVDNLRARWWFNQYFGVGRADATAARAAPAESAAAARGAWALEAVRLADGDIARAKAAWTGAPLEGPTLSPPARVGRYDLPFPIDAERALPGVPGFGGSRRLVGETDDEDVDIALLEGAWFREATGADTFSPYLDDVRPRVRYTALRAFRSLPSPDAEARLTALGADPDPIVHAHVVDALRYRTWEGKGKRPPGAPPPPR